MKNKYWKKIKIVCPTKKLREYNNGDLIDTIYDLFDCFDTVFITHGIGIKHKFQVQFTSDEGTFAISEDRTNEMLEMTIEVTAPTFNMQLLTQELEKFEMQEGFKFYEEKYGVLQLVQSYELTDDR